MPGHYLSLKAAGRKRTLNSKSLGYIEILFSLSPSPFYAPTYKAPDGEWPFNESHDTLLALLTLVLALTHSIEYDYSHNNMLEEQKTKTMRRGRNGRAPDYKGRLYLMTTLCSLQSRLNPAFFALL